MKKFNHQKILLLLIITTIIFKASDALSATSVFSDADQAAKGFLDGILGGVLKTVLGIFAIFSLIGAWMGKVSKWQAAGVVGVAVGVPLMPALITAAMNLFK